MIRIKCENKHFRFIEIIAETLNNLTQLEFKACNVSQKKISKDIIQLTNITAMMWEY